MLAATCSSAATVVVTFSLRKCGRRPALPLGPAQVLSSSCISSTVTPPRPRCCTRAAAPAPACTLLSDSTAGSSCPTFHQLPHLPSAAPLHAIYHGSGGPVDRRAHACILMPLKQWAKPCCSAFFRPAISWSSSGRGASCGEWRVGVQRVCRARRGGAGRGQKGTEVGEERRLQDGTGSETMGDSGQGEKKLSMPRLKRAGCWYQWVGGVTKR